MIQEVLASTLKKGETVLWKADGQPFGEVVDAAQCVEDGSGCVQVTYRRLPGPDWTEHEHMVTVDRPDSVPPQPA